MLACVAIGSVPQPPLPQTMMGIVTFAGGVLGAKMVCFASLESVNVWAGYGPEPDVAAALPFGDSVPVAAALLPVRVRYVAKSVREMQKIPPAIVSSPVAGK